jgi:HNH endonuclease
MIQELYDIPELIPKTKHSGSHNKGRFNTLVRQNGYRRMSCKTVPHYLTVDHIRRKMPYTNPNIYYNLQLLCLTCHRTKDEIKGK